MTGWYSGAAMQKQGHCSGSNMIHALPEVCRTRFGRVWANDGSIKGLAEAGEDARQSISSATTTLKASATDPAGGTSPSLTEPRFLRGSTLTTRTATEVATSAKADAAAPMCTPSAPSKTVFWTVLEEELMQTQQLKSDGTGLGEGGSSMQSQ